MQTEHDSDAQNTSANPTDNGSSGASPFASPALKNSALESPSLLRHLFRLALGTIVHFQERRLRSGPRLVLHALLWFILILLFSLVFFAAYLVVDYLWPGFLEQTFLKPSEKLMQQPELMTALNGLVCLTGIGALWLAGLILDRRPFTAFGFTDFTRPLWWREFLIGFLLGAILIALIFIIEWTSGLLTISHFWHVADIEAESKPVSGVIDARFTGNLLLAFTFFVFVGIQEELLSRSYHMLNLYEMFRTGWIPEKLTIFIAVLFSSSVFGILHYNNPNATLLSTMYLIIAGIALAVPFLLTGRIAMSIGLHISWNFFQGQVFGFPVSGTRFMDVTIISIQQHGPAWLTGGAFGPEAGIFGPIADLIIILSAILYAKYALGSVRNRLNTRSQ
ncbi:MAG: CPBP family intramembrane metalloprotease [Leptospiraceae bacterium]|nr:CPBP family intramembrane metalloprotease [Leptospiraceae bacterium]